MSRGRIDNIIFTLEELREFLVIEACAPKFRSLGSLHRTTLISA